MRPRRKQSGELSSPRLAVLRAVSLATATVPGPALASGLETLRNIGLLVLFVLWAFVVLITFFFITSSGVPARNELLKWLAISSLAALALLGPASRSDAGLIVPFLPPFVCVAVYLFLRPKA